MQKLTMTKQELFEWVDKNLKEFDRQEILFLDYDGPSPVNEDVRLESWTTLKTDDLRHMEVFEKLPNRLNKLFLWAMNKTTNVYELAQAYKNISNIDFEALKSTHTILKMYRYKRYDYQYLVESNQDLEMFLDLLVYIVNNNHLQYIRQVHVIRRRIVMRAYEGYPDHFVSSQEFKRLVETAK